MMSPMHPLTLPHSRRIASFGETVFATYTRLAAEHGAVNLGQGFPDFAPPAIVMDAYRRAADTYQQYAPLPGMPQFNEAIATVKGAALGRNLDPLRNVQVTVGATEALFAVAHALLDPGEEVILLEPFYDAYPADVLMAGGVPRYVPLHPQADGSWQLDFEELARTFSAKTKAIFINTPHNPTGKMFSASELDEIVRLAEQWGAIIVSDEAYEHIVFEPHVSPASRPGAWERTVAISSVGKTFSVTGWKVGWVVGPEDLVHAVRMAHQWIPYTVATPLQLAAAEALTEAGRADSPFFQDLQTMYQGKRDLLLDALAATPFRALTPQGSYFVMADSSALGYKNDVELCLDLPQRIGVAAIPPSAFYSEPHKHLAKHMVRFAFCKSDAALREAGERLKRLGD
ncbi:methionine aminotransferase [soil metagenome]